MNAALSARSARLLSAVAAVSGLYDIALGMFLLLGRGLLMRAFSLPAPVPPIHADLNGLFALAIGIGYALPWRRPEEWRAYLWVMGPFLKGGGAVLFLADYALRGSSGSFLIFAACDGTLAIVTLAVLLATRSGRPPDPLRGRTR